MCIKKIVYNKVELSAPEMKSKSSKKIRLNLAIPGSIKESIERIQIERDASSLTEVIQQALKLYVLIYQAQSEKKSVLVRDSFGQEKEVFIL